MKFLQIASLVACASAYKHGDFDKDEHFRGKTLADINGIKACHAAYEHDKDIDTLRDCLWT